MRAVAALLCLVLAAGSAAAQGRPRAPSEPGKFDFYVLALSWSPSYCEAAGNRADRQQCAGKRPFSFVVHGLWPQNESGPWPESCSRERKNLPRSAADAMLDIMPSRQLVYRQWDQHGTCTGLGQEEYLKKVRLARAMVKIPPAFVGVAKDLTTSPFALEQSFIAENPGLGPEMIAVTCQRRLLREVRICLDKDLKFHACPEVDRRACRSQTILMPPERGGDPAAAEPMVEP